MRMCCPNCKGAINPADSEQEWECEDCEWKGHYQRLTEEKAKGLFELIKLGLEGQTENKLL